MISRVYKIHRTSVAMSYNVVSQLKSNKGYCQLDSFEKTNSKCSKYSQKILKPISRITEQILDIFILMNVFFIWISITVMKFINCKHITRLSHGSLNIIRLQTIFRLQHKHDPDASKRHIIRSCCLFYFLSGNSERIDSRCLLTK